MSVPTVTIDELSKGIEDYASNRSVKNVLEGILNDYMDLQYAKETPYTTGKQVIPSGSSVDDVENGIQSVDGKFKEIFEKISSTHKSGDFSPQSVNDGSWEANLKPVFVFVTPNP
ncbi:hypothetical protein KGM_214310 [Danaus plexippus plexippus]|uniref:Uncharacterized protein n=1 Tax=Danaus plexippus plexippus TaxID=278856 RepID=A0A212EH04_DANPL|nr:hypothetical protein KGM_214310 [Danaus plexippus plexippus]